MGAGVNMQDNEIKNIENADFDLIENAVVALREIWAKKLLVILVTIAGLLCALIITAVKGNSDRYYSSATLFSAVYGASADASEGVAVMNKYAEMIGSSRVCNRAAKELTEYNISSEDLKQMVANGTISMAGANTNAMSYGYKLTLSVFSDSQETILPITNAMADAFAAELNDLIGSSTIQVMDQAVSYSHFKTTNTTLILLLGTFGAFIAACGVIFVLAFFSPWVKSVNQCESDSDLILGLLPYVKGK